MLTVAQRSPPLLLAAVLAGCATAAGPPASPSPRFAGAEIATAPPAPPLNLSNYDGAPVSLAQFRGKAVLVTFLYTRCPNVCPVIVSNLHAAQAQLGAEAARVQIIAVTTDPAGDTPQAVAGFLAARQMAGRMLYLLGSAAQVKIAWTAWNVQAEPDAQEAGLVNHTAAVFGVTASGQVKTVYPDDVAPAAIVHDVPLLAQE